MKTIKKILLCAAYLWVFSTPNARAQGLERQEIALNQIKAMSGNFVNEGQSSIAGRVFRKVLKSARVYHDESVQAVYSSEDYNGFGCYVGLGDEEPEGARAVFTVLGDGQVLFKSPVMSIKSRAIRVSIPLDNISGVTLKVENTSNADLEALFAEPNFIAFKPIVLEPTPIQPPVFQPEVPERKKDVMLVRQLASDNIVVDVNGRKIDFGYVQPQIVNGRVFVPMRPIFEAMGAFVAFNPANKEVVAIRDKTQVKMVIGSQWASKNSTGIKLDAPAFNKFGTTLVPLRFVGEAFDVNVRYSN